MDVHSVLLRSASVLFKHQLLKAGPNEQPTETSQLAVYQELLPRVSSVRVWDLSSGDAQLMAGVEDETFDFVHSSHCLEHLVEPREGLENWFRILRPGGHLVITVPDEDMYEQGEFPSTFNNDHKWTFSIHKQRSWSDRSRNILDMMVELGEAADVQKIEVLNATFRYGLPRFDQTLTPVGESGIEIVVRKRPIQEIESGGRLPPPGELPDLTFRLLTGFAPPKRN